MSKRKKTNKQPQQLSPENYIRQKARSLPILECWVNEDWKETKMATITIARKHSNGNISSASYLVDLYCAGVKDTGFQFNISPLDYDDYLDEMHDAYEFIKIDYKLAHNIIFAGYEFALNINLDPHKDFSKTTMYFLEEDNDNVDLIDIECGQNGKPVIIRNAENYNEANIFYNRLNESLGADHVILKDKYGTINHDEWDEEKDDFLYDLIYDDPETERDIDIKNLKRLLNQEEDNNEEEVAGTELAIITDRLFYNYYGIVEVEETRDRIFGMFDMDIMATFPDQLIGFNQNNSPERLENLLICIDEIEEAEDPEVIKQKIKEYPDIPYFKYILIKELEFRASKKEEISELLNQIKIYRKEHPDYRLLEVIEDKLVIMNDGESKLIKPLLETEQEDILYALYKDRDALHPIEFFEVIYAIAEYYVSEQDFLKLDALLYALYADFPDSEELYRHLSIKNIFLKTLLCSSVYIDNN